MSDLGWEDKELVLRVLFAKINALNPQNYKSTGGLGPKRQQMPNTAGNNYPVFISEGANMPGDHDGDMLHQFEVGQDGGGGGFEEDMMMEGQEDYMQAGNMDENGVYKPSAALERMLQSVEVDDEI